MRRPMTLSQSVAVVQKGGSAGQIKPASSISPSRVAPPRSLDIPAACRPPPAAAAAAHCACVRAWPDGSVFQNHSMIPSNNQSLPQAGLADVAPAPALSNPIPDFWGPDAEPDVSAVCDRLLLLLFLLSRP